MWFVEEDVWVRRRGVDSAFFGNRDSCVVVVIVHIGFSDEEVESRSLSVRVFGRLGIDGVCVERDERSAVVGRVVVVGGFGAVYADGGEGGLNVSGFFSESMRRGGERGKRIGGDESVDDFLDWAIVAFHGEELDLVVVEKRGRGASIVDDRLDRPISALGSYGPDELEDGREVGGGFIESGVRSSFGAESVSALDFMEGRDAVVEREEVWGVSVAGRRLERDGFEKGVAVQDLGEIRFFGF